VIVALLGLRDQLAFRHDDAGDDVGALVEEFSGRIFQHSVLLDDIKEAVLRETAAVGNLLRQGRGELLHLVADAAARAIGHDPGFRLAGADECCDALRADRDMPCVRHQRVERDLEARRQLDLGKVLLDLIGFRPTLRDLRPVSRAAGGTHRAQCLERAGRRRCRLRECRPCGQRQCSHRHLQMKFHRCLPAMPPVLTDEPPAVGECEYQCAGGYDCQTAIVACRGDRAAHVENVELLTASLIKQAASEDVLYPSEIDFYSTTLRCEAQ
jgi:hypothetical protein